MILFIANEACTESDDIDMCNEVNPPNNKFDCYVITKLFTVDEYACCYIEGKADGILVRACLRVMNTKSSLDTLIKTIKDKLDSKIIVHCSAIYLACASLMLFIILLL